MAEATNEAHLALKAVFWLLALVAVFFAAQAARHGLRAAQTRRIQARVAARSIHLEVREVQLKKGKHPFLFAVTRLELERLDNGRRVTHLVDRRITKDELATHEFLDQWAVGSTVPAAEAPGKPDELTLAPRQDLGAAAGLMLGAWMFGVFAWFTHPFAWGAADPFKGAGWKVLATAALIVAVPAWLFWQEHRSRTVVVERAPVNGFGKRLSAEALVSEMKGLGLTVADNVAPWLEDGARLCEYEYAGKTWRTASLWCQPPEGEACPGRLNPDNPRDVKWDREE